MSRKTATLKLKSPVITVIGEGISEQYYFKHIRSLFGYRYTLKPYFFGTTSILDMDRKISEILEGGGIAVCVFDGDVSLRVEAERLKLHKLLSKYIRRKNVIFCISLPSIEYWFLLHYKNTNRHFNDAKAVSKNLKRFVEEYNKSEKFLENQKWVSDLCANNKLEVAIERAKNFGTEGGAYSNIYKAFETFRR